MSAQWALAATQIGTRLLESYFTAQSAKAIAEARNSLVQTQLDARAAQLTSQRRRYIGQITGAQQASMAASGLIGGRTARLVEAQARRRASQVAQVQKTNIAMKRITAQTGMRMSQLSADLSVGQSLFDAVLSGAKTYQRQSQQSRATQGSSSGGGPLLTNPSLVRGGPLDISL